MEKSWLFCSIESVSCTYKKGCFYIQMDGLAIMGCSGDTLKTLGVTKSVDIAALRGFVSQKVFLGGNSRCRESHKKELANAVHTGKSV